MRNLLYALAVLLLCCSVAAQAQQMRGSVEAKDCGPGGSWQSVAAATGLVTCGSGTVDQTATYNWTGQHTFASVLGSKGNSGTAITGSTYTFQAADCGKTVVFNPSGGVTATIPASIVPATTVCNIGVLVMSAQLVTLNGSAVTPATLLNENGYTKTSGHAGSFNGLSLLTVSGTTYAVLLGSGS